VTTSEQRHTGHPAGHVSHHEVTVQSYSVEARVAIAVLVSVLIVVAAIVTAAHSRAPAPRLRPEPRELVRRALAVLPSDPDREATARAIDRVVETDPRVDVVVVEPPSPALPVVEDVAPRVTVLRPAAACTPVGALRVGAARGMVAGYDAVIELSVEHSPLARSVTGLLEALDDGAHVAVGSRHVPGGRVPGSGSCRRLLSREANRVLGWLTRVPLYDVTARIRAYRREAIELAVLPATDDRFGIEVMLRCRRAGLRFAEVPVSAGCVCASISLADGRAMVGRALRWRGAALRVDGLRDLVRPLTAALTGR
jgi:dolichol-phosphate mannosyltransferase